MWKHITSESSKVTIKLTKPHNFQSFQGSLSKLAQSNGGSAKDTSHNTPDEDDEAITINVVKASPDDPKTSCEQQPLLRKRKDDGNLKTILNGN